MKCSLLTRSTAKAIMAKVLAKGEVVEARDSMKTFFDKSSIGQRLVICREQ